MVLILALAAILFALMFPETPTGRFAKRHFVDAPAQWLNNLSPLKVFALIAVAIVVTLCSAAFPAEIALIAAGDLTAYIEIAAALAVLTSKLRIRQFAARIIIVVRRLSIQVRRFAGAVRLRVGRLRPVRHSKADSSDEDGAPVPA
ncbi:hypothetical protein [Asticcacaulis sp.]|uniref:hypothetical protein n=1 Tax=Asticcacaulis sp. TaxID=1872648 RepID=UPI002CFB6B0F|nr:hypothetical protein [Asticcacaulis sp.]HTM79968.1 hypothetical protein [Asticcacaulis sp.]